METTDLVRFREFEINVQTGELRKEGVPVALERQPARVLARLVAGAGRLVTRDDLCRVVWPAGTHVDFDRGLNYCLRQIRVALNDDARTPYFIETLPRQGYRFIAPICAATATPAIRPARRRWPASIAAALLAAATVYAVEAGPRNEDHHRIAMHVVQAVHNFLF
jgi:DNA-binding winged helix-turn-helix (wHTH) protein